MFPHVHLPSLYPAPRKSPEGESVEVPAFLGHWQYRPLLLPSGNPHHRIMGGKSEALHVCGPLSAVCGAESGFRVASFQIGSCASRERQELVWL